MMERSDGSVSLYYTRPDDPAQHVVYDTLDTPTPSLLARTEAAEDEVRRLRALWERAIDADILDDAHELGNAIADASWLLNYPPPEDDDDDQNAAGG